MQEQRYRALFMISFQLKVLNEGKTIISYKLLRPGNDYDNPISSIDISIWLGDDY